MNTEQDRKKWKEMNDRKRNKEKDRRMNAGEETE